MAASSSGVKPKSGEESAAMSGTSRRGLSITESSESIMRTTGEEKKPSDTPDCTGTPSRSSARRNTAPDTFAERSRMATSP